MRRNVCVVVLGTLVLIAGCAKDDAPYHQVRGGQFTQTPVIYSTRSSRFAEGRWRFLLMPGEYYPNSSGNYSRLYNLPELLAAFRRLEPATGIQWRNDTRNDWTYPPDSLIQRVKKGARQAGHKVWLNPPIE